MSNIFRSYLRIMIATNVERLLPHVLREADDSFFRTEAPFSFVEGDNRVFKREATVSDYEASAGKSLASMS